MLVVLIILGVISSIAYPMLFMNEKITSREIKESAKRNDIRSIESFLKDDLRNCSNFNLGQPEDGYCIG
jgi:type II secretory pathway pseudopilin PulG